MTMGRLPAQDLSKPDPLELGIFGIGSCHTNNRNAKD
ncbi:MAG: hypothetical protein JWL81_747, partial [Verrucomicrobiales bacterium]|nr:hypothetical protein [Verrucomicrobiales bacterium]